MNVLLQQVLKELGKRECFSSAVEKRKEKAGYGVTIQGLDANE